MIQVKFAEKCAWRATYVYVGKKGFQGFRSHKLCHIGIDPTASTIGPSIFGGFYPIPRRVGFSFRIKVPHISWSMVMRSNYNKSVIRVYQWQQNLFHKIDGRYGPSTNG